MQGKCFHTLQLPSEETNQCLTTLDHSMAFCLEGKITDTLWKDLHVLHEYLQVLYEI